MIAIDANAMVAMLVDDGELGATTRAAYADHDLAAPDLLPYEVSSVLRKLSQRRLVAERVAGQALRDLALVRLSAVPYRDIAARMWELRATLSAYDAAYVAVAELLDVSLLTFDAKVRGAPGTRCKFVDM